MSLQACGEEDEDGADDSTEAVPWTLHEARVGAERMKLFSLANQQVHAELRKYMNAAEGVEKFLEKISFSARLKHSRLMEHPLSSALALSLSKVQ